MRKAFTMIELVFVIVVLGILSAIAIPKLAATRDDAHITRAIATVATVRSGIITERQARLFRGDNNFINHIDSFSGAVGAGSVIFDHNGTAANQILTYGVVTSANSGGWMKTADDAYTFTLGTTVVPFTYTQSNGRFDCNRTTAGDIGQLCRDLVD